jgi:hypothetical protein
MYRTVPLAFFTVNHSWIVVCDPVGPSELIAVATVPFAVHAPDVENLTSGGVDESKARTSVPPLLNNESALALIASGWNDPTPVLSTPSITELVGVLPKRMAFVVPANNTFNDESAC